MSSLNCAHVNESERQKAESGMRVEGVSQYAAGSVLYRFVQRADVKDEVYIASPWWFQSSAVRRILQAAREGVRQETTPSGQASKMAALSSTWSRSGAKYLLAGKVISPLTVFWGAPRPVGKSEATQKIASGLQSGRTVAEIEITPDPRCVQLFIPGMDDQSLARRAFKVISRATMAASPELARGEIEIFLRNASLT